MLQAAGAARARKGWTLVVPRETPTWGLCGPAAARGIPRRRPGNLDYCRQPLGGQPPRPGAEAQRVRQWTVPEAPLGLAAGEDSWSAWPGRIFAGQPWSAWA